MLYILSILQHIILVRCIGFGCGFRIKGVEIVDLALIGGIPSFKDVFDAVVNEVEIEKYTMAEDVKQTNVDLLEHIQKNLNKSEVEYIPHVDLKEMSKNVKFAIRTGEFSYYPNIILQAGVVF